MAYMRQAEYARRHGISREAVRQRTRPAGGPIPVYGRAKLIDDAEPDAIWERTMSAQALSQSRWRPSSGAARRRVSSPRHHTDCPAADGAWEVLEWRAWVTGAAAQLATTLAVEVDRITPLLASLVETQLSALDWTPTTCGHSSLPGARRPATMCS
jgi:hypothetical protein